MKMKLFLKYYLSENDNSLKITTIEELMQYPNRKLNMQQNCIKNGNKEERQLFPKKQSDDKHFADLRKQSLCKKAQLCNLVISELIS